MRKASRLLTAEQQTAISDIIAKAEAKTCGEVVPVVVTRAGEYPHANYIFGFILSMISFIVSWYVFHDIHSDIGNWANIHTLDTSLFVMLLIMIIAFIVGVLLANVFPVLKLLFVSRLDMQHEVERRACEAFIHYNVGRTHNAAGIVIFIALFERVIRIQGDCAISEKLSREQWHNVREEILKQFKKRDYFQGIVNGIEKAGDLLKEHFPAEKDKKNELANEIYLID